VRHERENRPTGSDGLRDDADGRVGPISGAAWMPHDLIVDLYDLPQKYSCDDLWYKFHDILLAIGARPDMKILAYRCEHSAGRLRRSPRVQLQFSTPQLLPSSQLRWAQLDAAASMVELGPGHPISLKPDDCELMRQIKKGLLDVVTQRIVSFNLACTAQRSSLGRFDIAVQTLTPVDSQARLATRAPPMRAADRP
jgi:hypothetical protein